MKVKEHPELLSAQFLTRNIEQENAYHNITTLVLLQEDDTDSPLYAIPLIWYLVTTRKVSRLHTLL